MATEYSLKFSNHGAARIQQRGISKKLANLIFTYADREVRRGGSVVGLSVSEVQIAELRSGRLISSAEAESLRKIVLLYSNATEELVTVIKGSSRQARAYARHSQQKYGNSKRSGERTALKHTLLNVCGEVI